MFIFSILLKIVEGDVKPEQTNKQPSYGLD